VADPLKTAHARRFGLAYLGLAALLGAAVGTFILLVERPAPKPPPPWSAWRPTSDTSLGRATEIAEHVARQYHLPSGNQLVRVRVVPGPGATDDAIRTVAVTTKADAQSADDFNFFDASTTVMYFLCGSGAKCAIKEGKPTTARHAVLRRQALELALYTFEYVKGTESVVTFFPPQKGKDPAFALFFRKGDLDPQLDAPLRRTLPQQRAPRPGELTPVERRTVDELTLRRLFQYFVQNNDNGRILVLAPPSTS
jgi:hypothetical protein